MRAESAARALPGDLVSPGVLLRVIVGAASASDTLMTLRASDDYVDMCECGSLFKKSSVVLRGDE